MVKGQRRMQKAGKIFLLFAVMIASSAVNAQDRPLLHPLFSDHAVLQRDRPITVWGWAAPNERITISLGMARARVVADASGAWRAMLPSRPAGGPYVLSARAAGGTESIISDVHLGDVYLCSGQSNMEFPARSANNGAGAGDDGVRLFKAPLESALQPKAMFSKPAHWSLAQGEDLNEFSAVCFFFAREIKDAAKAPIGLIQSAWGGTRIESWISDAGLRSVDGFDAALDELANAVTDPVGARARFEAGLVQWWMKNDPGARAGWGGFEFDDSKWPRVTLDGGSWENSDAPALAEFDGAVWFRTEFNLTKEQAAHRAELTLGPIDDIDVTFLNGAVIGGESGWQSPRTYQVPAGTLRPGRNTLAVGVLDTIGGGGLWGEPETRTVRFADGSAVAIGVNWRYKISAGLWDLPPPPPRAPWDGQDAYTGLYNAMISPLAPFGLRGVLWYQGESNVASPDEYARLLPALMRDWRKAFEAPHLPFLIVQLANFGAPAMKPQPHSWGGLREAQRRAVAADANAGLAVTIDIGDRFDIHPTQKSIVAQRLARIARRLIYGEEIVDIGPTPVATKRAGDAVIIDFDHGPLVTYSAARPIAFELCDTDRDCRFADAAIDGSRVKIDARGSTPAFVRYCWEDAPICNLYNDSDLPAVPFEAPIEH